VLDDSHPKGLVDRFINHEILSADGESIGTIGEVYNNRLTEVPTWFRVDSGFLGAKKLLVPVAGMDVDSDDKVVTPYSTALIKDQPDVTLDGGVAPEDEQLLVDHFGLGATDS
jgi:hypothetical protein